MGRMHHAGVSLAIGASVLALAGCGGGDSPEDLISEAIENETGGSVDVDFEDGGINIDTEDGEMSIDEDGNFTVEGEDGEEVTGNVDTDDNGDFNIETDDGELNVSSDGELPEEWPSDIPVPDGTLESSSVATSGDEQFISIIGSTDDSPGDFIDSYGADLEGAGLTSMNTYEAGDSAGAQYGDESWSVLLSANTVDGKTQFTVAVTPASS